MPESDVFDPEWTIKTLAEEGCTVYMGVPAMLDSMSKSPSFASTDLSRVLFISGGGVLFFPASLGGSRRGGDTNCSKGMD